MKTLSFVIPAYNSAHFLDKCIPSMLVPQLLSKIEIIVVNDGSTDATAETASRYCQQYPDTVRLISQENKGHGGALNTGCAAAQGKYLKVIDADDWVVTENLPQLIGLLDACESDVVLTHHHTIDIGTGEIKCWRSFPRQFGKAYDFAEIMSDWRSFDRSLTFHGITYRTAFYHKYTHGLLEHVFYEDHEYATYPCCYARSVTPFDLFLYEYRIGDVNQSVSNANQLKRIGHTEAVLKRMMMLYRELPESAGKEYAAMKIQGLLLSYLTTAMLVEPDKKSGRELAAKLMAACKENAPRSWELARNKYRVFCLLNRFHITKKTWDALLGSRLYNRVRKNHSFD
jgi:glycosyltransferase involved in cell wall biosynthesis